MNDSLATTAEAETDHLTHYIDGVGKLTRKFGVIAEHQRESANSLGRAVSALRSIAALNTSKHHPDSRNMHPANGNAASVK